MHRIEVRADDWRYWKGCGAKVTFPSVKRTRNTRRRRRRVAHRHLSGYRCGYCGQVHLTTQKDGRR